MGNQQNDRWQIQRREPITDEYAKLPITPLFLWSSEELEDQEWFEDVSGPGETCFDSPIPKSTHEEETMHLPAFKSSKPANKLIARRDDCRSTYTEVGISANSLCKKGILRHREQHNGISPQKQRVSYETYQRLKKEKNNFTGELAYLDELDEKRHVYVIVDPSIGDDTVASEH